jgi:hypothetical protein
MFRPIRMSDHDIDVMSKRGYSLMRTKEDFLNNCLRLRAGQKPPDTNRNPDLKYCGLWYKASISLHISDNAWLSEIGKMF